MPDTYVDVGLMSVVKDPNKVAAKHTVKARELMRAAAIQAFMGSGFTPNKTGNPKGFHVDATLTEVTFGTHQGQPSVTCKLNGLVATFPEKQVLTKTLTGSATLAGGTTDRDVNDCIKAAVDATIKKSVIPYLKTKGTP